MKHRLRILLPLTAILLFLIGEWWGMPRPIRQVRWVGNTHTFDSTGLLAGSVLLETENPQLDILRSQVTAWGWDGRKRWSLDFSRDNNDLTAVSPDGRCIAGLRLEGRRWCLINWRDGKKFGKVTLPANELPYDWLSRVMVIRNDGCVIIAQYEVSAVLLLLAVRGDAIIARGSFTPRLHPERDDDQIALKLQADGAALALVKSRDGLDHTDIEYRTLRLDGPHFQAILRYMTQGAPFLKDAYGVLTDDYQADNDGGFNIYTPHGPMKTPTRLLRLNDDNYCMLLHPYSIEIDDTPPFVLSLATGERWTIPCIGEYRTGHVSTDGRFAAVIVQRSFPRWANALGERWIWLGQRLENHPPAWELRVYERPGRLRAYARARETSPICDQWYPSDFRLSPDGHTIIFANGYHWKIYRW